MNEEELKNKIEECDKLIITYGKREDWDRLLFTERVKGIFQAELRGFQKGKLEERERINKIIDKLDCKGETHGFRPKWIDAEQLQKEIREEKQDESS